MKGRHSLIFNLPRRCIEKGCRNIAAIGMWRCKAHLNPPKKNRRAKQLPPSEETQNWIYFLRGENGLIKIGRTSEDVEKRIASIRTMSPIGLELMASLPAHPLMERLLHKIFAHRRKHGEWFEPCEKLLNLVDAIKRGHKEDMRHYLMSRDADYSGEYIPVGVPPEFADTMVMRDEITRYYTEFDEY